MTDAWSTEYWRIVSKSHALPEVNARELSPPDGFEGRASLYSVTVLADRIISVWVLPRG